MNHFGNAARQQQKAEQPSGSDGDRAQASPANRQAAKHDQRDARQQKPEPLAAEILEIVQGIGHERAWSDGSG